MDNTPPQDRSFPGPNALWLDEEGDEYALSHVVREAKMFLSYSLLRRLEALDPEMPDVDALILEIRLQTAEAGVTGDLVRAKDLADVALGIVYAKETSRRFM